VKIRPARLEDVPPLVAMGLRFAATTDYARHFVADPERIARTVGDLVQAPDLAVILVLENGDALEGGIGLVRVPHLFAAESYVAEVFWWVNPNARGRAGLELLRHAERWAVGQGAALHIGAPDPRVGALLERRGYTRQETVFYKRFSREG
jgi:Acetyltransferase (GNAT) family